VIAGSTVEKQCGSASIGTEESMSIRQRVSSWLALGLCALGMACHPAGAQTSNMETVTFGGAGITGYLMRPAVGASPAPAPAPAPAIVALHGCGGVFTRTGGFNARETDWAKRWAAAGYAVLFPDSFGSRGLGPQCQVVNRQVVPRMRAGDAATAADWLAAQPFVDKTRLALIGWSHGGSTVLWTVRTGFKPAIADFKLAVAFYPGCRVLAEQPALWAPRLPLTILMGSADDWTPPEPCRALDARLGPTGNKTAGWRYIEYAGAFHGFDAPNTPVRVRTGLVYSKNGDGQAHVGTDPAARAQAIDVVARTLADAFR
jgi:dienelactone hydrolase